MANHNKGMSLMELMIVVAIIAALTAAAIPAYRSYLRDARLGSARQYMDAFNNQIKKYYLEHGTFPGNTELQVSTSIPADASEYLHKPYLAYMLFSPQTTTAIQCQYGTSTAYFSNYQGDYFADGTSLYVVLTYYYINDNGNMKTLCSFYEYDPVDSESTRADVFPDCLNTDSPETSSIMTLINSACN